MTATRARFADGRWHFQHGPIDLVVGADGDADAVGRPRTNAAWERFATILDELVAELPMLREAVGERCPLRGVVARRMWRACEPHRADFVTPMAAVAGSVADELIACYRRPGIHRAWVNNGGDIALHLARRRVAARRARRRSGALRSAGTRAASTPDGRFIVTADLPVRGIATSGWRGRSFSLGIADSVTVLARTAADADAAATMIANAVDVDDPRIVRRPASTLKDDSDLGDLPVTVDVPPLGAAGVHRALRQRAPRTAATTAASDGLIAGLRDRRARASGRPSCRRATDARGARPSHLRRDHPGSPHDRDPPHPHPRRGHPSRVRAGPRPAAAARRDRDRDDQSVRRPLRGRDRADDGRADAGRASTWRGGCIAAMDVPIERIESYGKGAIVGSAGELEHGALWHVPGGYAMRELLGWKGDRVAYAKGQGEPKTGQQAHQSQNALAIVPATKKVGGPGTTLDVPLTHINASYVRSHFDAVEVTVPGRAGGRRDGVHPRDVDRARGSISASAD